MPKNKHRSSKFYEGITSSYKRVEKFVSKFVAPYLVPGLVIYGFIEFFSIPLNKKVFLMVGSAVLWVVYFSVVILLALRIKSQADMQKTQQKLKSLSGRRVASEIEAFAQDVFPIVFDVVIKLGFAIGLLYLHLVNEQNKWTVYSDRLVVILLITIGILLLIVFFSIAFYVSKIDVEVVKNAKEKVAKKKDVESVEHIAQEEKTTTEQAKRPTSGYHPYFDPKLEGSVNFGLKPGDVGWEDYATSPFNLHPSNPNRDKNAVMPKPMAEFMNKYAAGEVKGLSEELLKPKEEIHKEPEKEVKTLVIVPKEEETSEKKVGEQPNRFSENLNIHTDHLQKVLQQRKTS